ncbi:MAG: DUF3024 domain-containing protein [Demequinaceae bacterium]|nr:DUF3024 domain-containing protein [Demequinaceae bacterium]
MPTSTLPETDVARIRRWLSPKVPPNLSDEIRMELDVEPRYVTIYECRPPWRADFGPEWTRFPIARLRYTKATRTWQLYWRDRHLRFHIYDRFPPSNDIEAILKHIDADPTHIFWG